LPRSKRKNDVHYYVFGTNENYTFLKWMTIGTKNNFQDFSSFINELRYITELKCLVEDD